MTPRGPGGVRSTHEHSRIFLRASAPISEPNLTSDGGTTAWLYGDDCSSAAEEEVVYEDQPRYPQPTTSKRSSNREWWSKPETDQRWDLSVVVCPHEII